MRSSSVVLMPSFSHHSSIDGGPLFLPSTIDTDHCHDGTIALIVLVLDSECHGAIGDAQPAARDDDDLAR